MENPGDQQLPLDIIEQKFYNAVNSTNQPSIASSRRTT
jgi:hypothetical protein